MRVAFVVLFISVCCVCRAQQIKEAEVPANVKTVAAKQSNGQPVTMWVLDKKRGKYIASVISTTAVAGIEISLDGKWIDCQRQVLVIQRCINAVVGGFVRGGDVEKII